MTRCRPSGPDSQLRHHSRSSARKGGGVPFLSSRRITTCAASRWARRWTVEGFLPGAEREPGAGRNLLGFKDGTSNPDVRDAALMDRLVWTPEGGTYAVVRIIRNRVEFRDRVARSEQEVMIGRDKATGAPLGRAAETDDPDYARDPKGRHVPLDAHIRRARPRTPATEDSRILRRGYTRRRARPWRRRPTRPAARGVDERNPATGAAPGIAGSGPASPRA